MDISGRRSTRDQFGHRIVGSPPHVPARLSLPIESSASTPRAQHLGIATPAGIGPSRTRHDFSKAAEQASSHPGLFHGTPPTSVGALLRLWREKSPAGSSMCGATFSSCGISCSVLYHRPMIRIVRQPSRQPHARPLVPQSGRGLLAPVGTISIHVGNIVSGSPEDVTLPPPHQELSAIRC